MYCRNCGSLVEDNKKHCSTCGFDKNIGNKYCPSCGNTINFSNVNKCPRCSFVLKEIVKKEVTHNNKPKSLLLAGFLQVFLPFISAGNFYLGFTKKAIIQTVVSLLTLGIGLIWPFIDGLLIFNGKVKVDAYGISLKD